MGFPFARDTVDGGMPTCHWHHARFELSCGDAFDPRADGVPTYPVAVRDGTVYGTPNRRWPPRPRSTGGSASTTVSNGTSASRSPRP